MPRIKVWKLKDPEKQTEFSEVFKAKTLDSELSHTSSVDVHWTSLKDKLLQATKQACGISSNHPWRKQTWWWNNQVEEAVREKSRCFKLWKAGCSRATYNTAKRTSNSVPGFKKFSDRNRSETMTLSDLRLTPPPQKKVKKTNDFHQI